MSKKVKRPGSPDSEAKDEDERMYGEVAGDEPSEEYVRRGRDKLHMMLTSSLGSPAGQETFTRRYYSRNSPRLFSTRSSS